MTFRAAVVAALAVTGLTLSAAPSLACGAVTPCNVNNGQPIEDIASFWRLIRNSPYPETAVTRVRTKFGPFPIDFIGDDHKHGGAYAHVSILGIKTDGIAYYSQAPVANVDVSILAPTFSGPSRCIVPVTIGGNSGAPLADGSLDSASSSSRGPPNYKRTNARL